MIIVFQKEYLDVFLVPAGLLIVAVYHLFLLYRYLYKPLTTAMGYENLDKRDWVNKVTTSNNAREIQNALTAITANITAATVMSTVSLTLCSLIGVWISNTSSLNNFIPDAIVYGNRNPNMVSVKYICLITSFLLGFSFFVQSARRFVHANYLISMPGLNVSNLRNKAELEVIRGGEFWLLGLRALYVALTLLLWFFGPIPMLVSSVFVVVTLYFHDSKKLDAGHRDQKDG